jgi:hypothetical protein
VEKSKISVIEFYGAPRALQVIQDKFTIPKVAIPFKISFLERNGEIFITCFHLIQLGSISNKKAKKQKTR